MNTYDGVYEKTSDFHKGEQFKIIDGEVYAGRNNNTEWEHITHPAQKEGWLRLVKGFSAGSRVVKNRNIVKIADI